MGHKKNNYGFFFLPEYDYERGHDFIARVEKQFSEFILNIHRVGDNVICHLNVNFTTLQASAAATVAAAVRCAVAVVPRCGRDGCGYTGNKNLYQASIVLHSLFQSYYV